MLLRLKRTDDHLHQDSHGGVSTPTPSLSVLGTYRDQEFIQLYNNHARATFAGVGVAGQPRPTLLNIFARFNAKVNAAAALHHR